MNSQFAPQQPFGIPPQNYPQNRTSPLQNLQGFQNVPLGPSKSGDIQNGPPQSMNYPPMKPSVNDTREQFMPNLSSIPPISSSNQFPPPINKSNDMKPTNVLNGPPQPSTQQFQNGPLQNSAQNGPGQLPPTTTMGFNSTTSQQQPGVSRPTFPGPNQQTQNNISFPPINQRGIPGQHFPSGNPSQLGGHPPFIGPQSTTPGINPILPPGLPSLPRTTQVSGPMSGPTQFSARPPTSGPLSGPPTKPGPTQLSGPPTTSGPSQLSGPPSMSGPTHLSGPPSMPGPNQLSGPPTLSGPTHLSGPSSGPGSTQLSGRPPTTGPTQLSGPPPPSNQFARQQPPIPSHLNHGTPIPPSTGPNGMGSYSGQFNQSALPNSVGGGLPPMPGQPPIGQPQISGQPPLPPSSLPNQPPLPNHPPIPGQMPPNQYPNMNQLNNQMQGMNLSGPRQYPGAGPMNNMMNGDNGPHMPPPLTQQQYMNNQQMRGPPGSVYPPMPGQQPMVGPIGPYPQSPYQQQNKKLDPDQMPSPIQVIEDDKRNKSGVFCTNQKGLVPPLVTTNFVVNDQGNASPRFIRASMYNVPTTQDIMKQTAIPFSLSISPMARTVENEYPPPIVNFGDLGPVRCIRCKAYMCPFMQFIDSGRRFQCLFCKATTDVPTEYFQHLDHTGQRMDRFERPELILGTYEFVATTDYCRNNTLPKPPAIIFVIDVSYNSMKSGLVHLLCSQMKSIIENLPCDGQEKSNMKVGFITYNSTVHFYNIKGTLAAPQMLVVGDVQEMFMPLLDGFLATPEESGPIIEQLMQQIPTMFSDTRETETILLPAILAGLEALKASECAGKLLVFHSTLPIAEAPGKLKNRDDRKLLSTDKERTVLTPQIQSYNQLGQDCVGAGCAVDLFIFNNAYIDIATIGQVSRLTGGEVFKYTYFQADIDGERLISDIITDISRPTAFDAIMRVRTSTGVRPTEFYGHFFMSNTTDVELAAIDCDKAIAVEIKHDDKLSEEDGVYIQTALLYTSCSGQRRLRIINLSLKTSSQMADLYRCCDSDTVINYIAKQSIYRLLEHNPKTVKDNLVTRTAQILATYRKNCASPSSAGQLILPECMKLLPLYINCLLKSDALSGGSEMTIDDRSYVMQAVMIMDITTSVYHFYPRLMPIHDIDTDKEPEVPSPIRCSVDKMTEQGVYILENGIHMFLWIGLGANPEFIQKLFDVPSAIQVDIERTELPKLDNPVSNAVRYIIDEIRYQRHRCMRLTLVRQREKMEQVYKHFLVEDRGTDGSPSYVDFLIHMHKEIRSVLS